MSVERPESSRHSAQLRLAAAQDQWINAVEKHGRNLKHPEVARARHELDEARVQYLNAIQDSGKSC